MRATERQGLSATFIGEILRVGFPLSRPQKRTS
jgi:hypothetical protein